MKPILPDAAHVVGWYANNERTIGIVKISRPRVKNCLSMQTYKEVADHLRYFDDDEAVLAVILIGEGDEYFTSGTDIREMDPSAVPSLTSTRHFMGTIVNFKKILIAAVNGFAIGIGVTLLVHCDFVFSVPSATFRTPFMGLGIIPEFGSSVTFPALLGKMTANNLLLRSKTLNADQALQTGLLTEILPAQDFLNNVLREVNEMTSQLHANVSLLRFKDQINRLRPLSKQQILAAIDFEYEEIDRRYRTGEVFTLGAMYLNELKKSSKVKQSKL